MCNKANLSSRIQKARAAMHFHKVVQRDNLNRPIVINVPGSNGKMYQVTLRRDSGKLYSKIAHIINKTMIAPSWNANHISYHVMAAIEISANEAGYNVVWFAKYKDAKTYSNFGGKVHQIINDNNHSVWEWFVVEKKEQQ